MVIDVRYDIDIGNRVSAKDRTKPFQPDLHGFHDCPRVKNWRIAILRREFLVEHDDPVLRGIVPKAMEQYLEIAVAHVGSMHFIGIGLQQIAEALVEPARFIGQIGRAPTWNEAVPAVPYSSTKQIPFIFRGSHSEGMRA